MKRLVLLLCLTLVLLSACLGEGNGSGNRLRVAYHPNFGGASAITSGIKQGFFKDEGLEIELVKFTSGPSEIAAMVSGDIQIGYIGFGAHTLAAEGKVQIIATDGIAVVEGIRTRKDSKIDSVEKLKGKTLGTQLGTSGETIIEQVLIGTPVQKSEIRILNSDISSAVAAFLAGKIDAIAVWPPYTVEIDNRLGKDNFNIIKPKNVGVDSTASWIVTSKYLEYNYDTVVKFVIALYKAMDYRMAHLDETITNVAELVNIDVSTVEQERYSSDWMNSQKMKAMLENGSIDDIYKKQIEYFVKNDRLNGSPVAIDRYVRTDIIKKSIY